MPPQLPSPGDALSQKFDRLLGLFSKQNKTFSTALTNIQNSIGSITADTATQITDGLATISNLANNIQSALNSKENISNKTIDIVDNSTSTVLYPNVKAVVDYVSSRLNNYISSAALNILLTNYATQAYVDNKVIGLMNYQGIYDASGNSFPQYGKDGPNSVIRAGDVWFISVEGAIGATKLGVGDLLIANVDNPGQVVGEWDVVGGNLGYVAENILNKNASDGYAGLSGFKIILKDLSGTFTSYLTNQATASRLWTFQDKSYTVAGLDDIGNSITALGLGTASKNNTADFDPAGAAATALTSANSYTNTMAVGLLKDCGSWDSSGNVNPAGYYPTSGGTGIGGAIEKGNLWFISTPGLLGTTTVTVGTSVRALVNDPGQVPSNWDIISTTLGFSPEDVARKSTTLLADSASDTKYPSVKSVYDWATGLFATISDVNGTLVNYVTGSSLATTLNNYVTTSALSAYETTANLATTLSSYVTNSSLATTLSSYATNSGVSAAISALNLGSASTHAASDFTTPAQVTEDINAAINAFNTGQSGTYDLANQVTITHGNYVANGSIATSGNIGAYSFGTLSFNDTYVFNSAAISNAGYVQNIIQNLSADTNASSDFIVANDVSTATNNYGDFGINSSTFVGAGSFQLPNATYLYSKGGELVLGTMSVNGIRFVVNNSAVDAFGINFNGALLVNGSSGTAGQVLTSGGAGSPATWGAANVGYVLAVNSTVTGTTAKLLVSVALQPGVYANVKAMLGCSVATNTATLTAYAGTTLLATLSNTGIPAQVSSSGFTLATETVVSFYLTGSTRTTNAFIYGIEVK